SFVDQKSPFHRRRPSIITELSVVLRRLYNNWQPYAGSSGSPAFAMIDGAVIKAHSDLLATGESVSLWRVANAALVMLNAVSFESLGFYMQDVPSLNRLMLIEAKVNSYIHRFVGVQTIKSVRDLEIAICESEGVTSFAELGLGPILKHPLVVHYFSSHIATASETSTAAQMPRLRPDAKIDCTLISCHERSNDCVAPPERERRSEIKFCTQAVRTPKILRQEFESVDVEPGFIDDNAIDGHTWRFIKKWKDLCEKEENAVEVFGKMLDFYRPRIIQKRKKKLLNQITSYPQLGLLNVAIASIKFGLWDRMSSSQANGKEVAVNTCAVDVNTYVEPAEENTLVANKHVLEGSVETISFEFLVQLIGLQGLVLGVANNILTGFTNDNTIDGHTWRFIKMWKDSCEKEENVVKVFDEMLDFYFPRKNPVNKIKLSRKMTVLYPHVGLLNVAIASIKFGLWDRMSSSQANGKEAAVNTCAVDVSTDVEPTEENTLVANKHVLEGGVGIALEEVLKHIRAYFVSPDYVLDNVTSYPRKQMIFLREICKLEISLTRYFSVNDFETLGFGDIFTFLSEHISILPTTWQKCFIITETPEKPLVKVCMSQHYLLELLSQAANNLGENETLSKLMVSELLRMQFPSAGLTLLEDEFTEDLLATRSKNGDNVNSSVVLFSSTLTDFRAEKDLSNTHVFGKDAVELLLSAPMLVDLTSWSSWDFKFAPSLGPLVGWLLSYVSTKELLCLVTKDGKVLRIDHSGTVDSFLEAILHGSSFETALQLVSLISLYGGERNVPLSLLKCYAKNGFEIMFKTSSSIASRFVLDCLGYLPKEFRSFAGDLLVSTFRSIAKDAYMVILSECKSKKDHMIIHELGLSLGIVEWFEDRCSVLSKSKESVENKRPLSENEVTRSLVVNQLSVMAHRAHSFDDSRIQPTDSEREKNAANIIESIRVQEFGMDPNISSTESSILEKQHARLGRALFCLSQELYSQDSHFLLELVQNADDNAYPANVEPTLTFILQEKSIVVLNNEHGFSAENIRALCDVGNSTKKASSAGYIGKKGIGFKSVFRVTDAPEVHSNGFHIKFDLTEGQIGFLLPTIVPPCDIDFFTNLVSSNTTDQMITQHYNTCLVLPLKSTSTSKLTETSTVDNITSMFSDLHPSLLLFLHRLQCIKFRNMLTDSFIIMRKEKIGNGLTNVSVGNETFTWFVDSLKLQTNGIRKDVKVTEISVALALEVLENGSYIPKLDQQFAFAFLPLRTYGLKFIIQGDFILPSSREEVDGDSPWNQWLLSEFPNLFVKAEMSFCSLPGFNNCLGKAVSVFLSYVPLVGEVHGFFAQLPRMIISKLCMSNCLLLEGENDKWVPPCRVLRNWNEQTRILLPDSLIYKHLGLGYLNKEIVLSDTLAQALCIENYGPKILVNVLSYLCHTKEGLASMGLSWLSSWLNELYPMSFQNPVDFEVGSNIMNTLTKTPFIPLLDGSYGSINEGMIWMNLDGSWNSLEAFTRLFANLRIFFLTNMMWEKVIIPPGSTVSDWESRELVELLAKVSLSGDRGKCKYLLEVFDEIWDDYFSDKVEAFCSIDGYIKPFKSSIWVVSSLDDGLYYPKGLFYNCEAVCMILGNNAPFAVPKIRSAKLVTSIGFKTNVTLHDALYVLEIWNRSKMRFKASFRHFFVNECGVKENPPLLEYFEFLHQLSTANTPLEAAKKVFDIFVMWSDGLKSGVLSSEDIEVLKRKLKKQKMKVLPTARDKWVSLHSSFGLVCWCDDEKLANEFEELNNINFFYLCELTDEEKEMLEVKVSFLMKHIGIPALSEVVTREAIYDGLVDNSYKVSLLRWALPYAQRYISNTYPERYHQLKLSGSEKINRLQVVVVEVLYFQNVIKRSKLTSKKRHDTICLLQDEILYVTCDSDSHPVFMELSRFLINGDPEIHLANFLHVITTMAESGSTEDQIERFILNSQKVPKLSDDEPIWSIQSLGVKSVKIVTTDSFPQINRNWPTIEEVEIVEASSSLNHVGQGGTSAVDSLSVEHDLVDQDGSLGFSQKNQLSHGSVNAKQAFLIGRRGEELAFNYYKNMGIKVVKWVNEASETGLPYDIEVCDDENRKEYIEVKTTSSKRKDWFEISVGEWQFAVKKGESFSIVRVVLLGNNRARVAVFKNPARLCQLGQLKLAVLMSEKLKDEFVLC
ncbi:hypothetical protein M8C21_003850, partial [Ambrosia artemisiifolia]